MEFNALSQYDANNAHLPTSSPAAQHLSGQEHMVMQQSSNAGTPEFIMSEMFPATSLSLSQSQSTSMLHPLVSGQSYPTWTPTALQTSSPHIKQLAETDDTNRTSMGSANMLRLQTNILTPPTLHTTAWDRKTLEDVDFSNLEHEHSIGLHEFGSTDDDASVIHLRQMRAYGRDPAQALSVPDSRRPSEMSDSTYSLASSGRLADPASFGEEVKFAPGIDWTGTLDARKSTRISPMESPRLGHPERARNGSISRPVGFNHVRSSPYDAAQSDRRNRWSTGSVSLSTPPPTTAPQSSRFSSVFNFSPLNPHNALSSVSNEHGITTFAAPGQQLSYTANRPISLQQAQIWGTTPWGMPRPLPSQHPMLSQGVEIENGEIIPEPPNIYESLEGEEAPPPEDCMNPDDEDMIPHQEDPSTVTNLYKPRWVRGKGHEREGWCGRCEGGCWAKLKNSGFWYHRSYTHGISPNTGMAYPPPCRWRLTDGNPTRWEGLCEKCGEWLKVDTTKKGHNSWFRHVVKCHPKNKSQKKQYGGIQKRRRTLSTLHYPSPFSSDITEERSHSEEAELMDTRELGNHEEESHYTMDKPHFLDDPQQAESDTTENKSNPIITTTHTTPTQPIESTTREEIKLSEAFQTPLHHHLLATPMTTPQLSSTPNGESASTPQIETPATTANSLMSMHGLGVHNLMIPFGLNMGLGVVDQQGSPFGADQLTPVPSSATTVTAADIFDFGPTSSSSSGLDGGSMHGTSSPMEHHTQQLLRSAYHTPHIVHNFSPLSAAYNSTPGLSSDLDLMSITSAPMESKLMSGDGRLGMHYHSALESTLLNSDSDASNPFFAMH